MGIKSEQQLRIHIRWMCPLGRRQQDIAEVIEIENSSFDFPWLEDDFTRCLGQPNSIGMVAEHKGRVAGFMIYELYKYHIHVLTFAVAHDYRRRGIGTQILDKLKAKISAQRRRQLTLEVRETNLTAQLFFRDRGFRGMKVMRNFYAHSSEDAYLMGYHHPLDTATPPR